MKNQATPRHSAMIAAAAGLVVGLGLAAIAGDLGPPAGPVAGTMKTLVDVEPRTAIRNDPGLAPIVISASGSYYLAEDIYALPGQNGITITASDVTLDLNGFAVRANLEVGSPDGIHLPPLQTPVNICVHGGVIRDFLTNGVSASQSRSCIFEDLRVVNCGQLGISSGQGALVSNCVVRDTGINGIVGQNGSLIRGCTSYSNGNAGIVIDSGTVHGCSMRDNVINLVLMGASAAHDNSAP